MTFHQTRRPRSCAHNQLRAFSHSQPLPWRSPVSGSIDAVLRGIDTEKWLHGNDTHPFLPWRESYLKDAYSKKVVAAGIQQKSIIL